MIVAKIAAPASTRKTMCHATSATAKADFCFAQRALQMPNSESERRMTQDKNELRERLETIEWTTPLSLFEKGYALGRADATRGDFVMETLELWEKASKFPEMDPVRFDIAAEILRNTYSVKEMGETTRVRADALREAAEVARKHSYHWSDGGSALREVASALEQLAKESEKAQYD